MIAITDTVTICADVISTEIDGELVLMDMANGRYIGMNAIATVVWRELEQPRQVGALCRALADRFEAPPGVIERDVLDLLCQMAEKQLIRQDA
ncbi:PqqD family protein [Zavarzinia sp. CC-PAN008]|uniref:PqqD family protein n=1 Tax=Zavarzinia sp. CC-PAN008 TaxID=3243332 RepID=UPI003F74686E